MPQSRNLGLIMREVDEDLAVFLGMLCVQKKGNEHPAPVEFDIFNESKGLQPKPDCSSPLNGSREHIVPFVAEDSFLVFETQKSHHNWQPDSPSLDLVEGNSQHYTVEAILVKTELENSRKKFDTSTQDPSPHKSSTSPAKVSLSRPTMPSSSKPSSRSLTPSRPASGPSAPNPSRPSSHPTASTPMRGKPPGPTTASAKAAGPVRPVSASRGRTRKPEEKPKQPQKSCSPPRMWAQIRGARGPTALVRVRGGSGGDGEDVNPVLMGTKMVDRVVNMRKLPPPPKQVECVSRDYRSRKSTVENSGFGRLISKKSLDMAIRHMDIRRSICDENDYAPRK